jgi:hypothetical protein
MDQELDDPTPKNAQKIDFSIDTVIAQTLGIATQELEFATQLAIKFSSDQDDSFKMRKDYLAGFIQHVGKLSDAVINQEPENGVSMVSQQQSDDTPPPADQKTNITNTVSDIFLRAISLPKNRKFFNSKTWRISDKHERDYTHALLTLFQKIPHFIYGIEDVAFEGYVGEDQKIHLKYSAQKDSPDYNFTDDYIKGINQELNFANEFGIDCRWDKETQTYVIKNADQLFRIAIYLHDEFADISPEAESVFTSTACSIRETYRPDECDIDSLTRYDSQIAILRGLQTILNQYAGADLFTITPKEINDAYFFIIGCNDDAETPQPDNAEETLRTIYGDLKALEASAPFVSFEMWPCENNFAIGVDDPEEIIPLIYSYYSTHSIDANITQGPKSCLIQPREILAITEDEKYRLKRQKFDMN